MTAQAPSPREDVVALTREAFGIVIDIKLRSDRLKERLHPLEPDPMAIRVYIDRVRNLLQALEGVAAALENGEGK